MEMILENMLESVNEYCEEINDEFVLSKPGEIIEYRNNGFVVSNDTERMIFTNYNSLSNFIKYSTKYSTKEDNEDCKDCEYYEDCEDCEDDIYESSCIYNEDNGKFIDTSIVAKIADYVRGLKSIGALTCIGTFDNEERKYYQEVLHVTQDKLNSYMDSVFIDILDFAGIDNDVSYVKSSDFDDIRKHLKKDFKTLCKLFLVVCDYEYDVIKCAYELLCYWSKDNFEFECQVYNVLFILIENEVKAELNQEFNISL